VTRLRAEPRASGKTRALFAANFFGMIARCNGAAASVVAPSTGVAREVEEAAYGTGVARRERSRADSLM
jgi:hypothetical protein